MSITKDLLGVAQTAQAAALVGDSLNLANKKRKKAKDFLGTGVRNLTGISLIKAQAELSSGL